MKMNDEKYRNLMLRFALELDDVGVTEQMAKYIESLCHSAPNRISASAEEVTDRFVYRHDGYLIEATRTVKLVVKTCESKSKL